MQKKVLILFLALMMGNAVQAQEIEKVDKFSFGYINGVYMGEAKYKTIDGVLYAVGYEGTKGRILVRYPAGSHNDTYTIHPYCRRIARGAFEGAAYLRTIYLPQTISNIGDNAFDGCTSLQGTISQADPVRPMTRGYRSSSTPTTPPRPPSSTKKQSLWKSNLTYKLLRNSKILCKFAAGN